MENGCNIASKTDVIICKRIDDCNSVGVETITPKKMLKIYENLNTFHCNIYRCNCSIREAQ